jgi:hypothetical protein
MCSNMFKPSGTAQRQAQMQIEAAQQAQFQQMQQVAQQQAEAAAQQEALRRQNIQSGQQSIDQAFGQFNDDYFGNITNAFKQAQMPGLQQQFDQARDQLTAALAGRGTLESTAGANQMAQLQQRFGEQQAGIGTQALEFANGIRGQVNDTRNNLLSMVMSGGDPSGIAARATGDATSLARTAATIPTAPLGSVLGAALQPILQGAGAAMNAPRTAPMGVPGGSPGGGGSQTVVGR